MGFEVPRGVRRFNAAVRAAEFDAWLDRLIWVGARYREGIPVDLWRALPDSPDA